MSGVNHRATTGVARPEPAASGAWYRDVSPSAWRALALAGLGWMFDVYDTFMLALTIPALIVAFSLSKENAGAIGSLLAAGLVVGGIGFGWVADRIGRVRALMISVAIYSVFSGLTAFAPSADWLAALRFTAGLGMGGAWTSGAALVAETWDARHRGKGGALMQIGLPLGSMLAIAVVAVVNSVMGSLDGNGWRVVYLLGFAPALVVLPLALKTPESPIWLNRAKQLPEPRAEKARGSVSYLPRLALAFGFIFFAQYIYWGVFTWTPAFLVSAKHLAFVKSLGFTLSQQFGSLIGFLVFAAMVDRFGRRPTFLGYLLIGAVSVGVFIYETSPTWLIVAMFWTGFGITGIFAGLGPLTAELAPPQAGRGTFMGIAYNGGRLGGILAPYLIGALASSDGNFILGMATTIPAFVLAAVIIVATPETKGMKLA
ncbi:Predicted arabinose efflux permease, MFS family [Enhydrobacter aerosaccus]|uniref:Predicted arabinose efflux permease, MFS family n=1 Tax=Enhydrobacter aerosaccus TaxID=225324 RepID=A0A1T4NBM8_9HYPH|nr:MFS transporter [Enhydrobacter aerosaccus]SJZ76679.1 Predicted arabinose efflux permease, MFS family [Enhydrobacter aerosaccus]